jgi:hypothetical protein
VGRSAGSLYDHGAALPRYVRLLIELAYGDEPNTLLKQIRRKRAKAQ